MKKSMAKMVAGILATVTILGCTGCNNTSEENTKVNEDAVVAVFEGKDIPQSEIKDMLDFMSAAYQVDENSENWDAMKYSTIQAYINDKICSLKADELKIKVTPEELQSEIDYAITQYGGEKAYEDFIASMNTTREFVEKQMESQLLYNKLFDSVTKDIKISDEDIQKYYDEHPDEFVTKETRDVYGIAFKTEEEAKKALTDLKAKKADFRKMANEKSLDNQNGDGFLGTVTKGDLVAAFDTAVFELEENAYCDKVLPLDAELADGTTAKYYYVIKATNFVPAKSMSFDNVKDELKNTLLSELKQAKYDTEFEKWKDNFDIEIKN